MEPNGFRKTEIWRQIGPETEGTVRTAKPGNYRWLYVEQNTAKI